MTGARGAVVALLVVLAACGGGNGGGGGGPRVPRNSPPVFTSAPAVSVPENSTGIVYTATAVDADGDALTFSLAGGADRGRFAITAGGALSFVAPPDFEAPADADGDNVYLVQIGVSDGTTSAVLNLAVTVTNGGNDDFRVSRVATGFAEPVFLTTGPGSPAGTIGPQFPNRVLVVERGGRIYLFDPATGARSVFLDLSSIVSTAGEGGLLGFALDPQFGASPWFYVFLTNPAGDIEVRRYRTLVGTREQGAFSSGDVILTIPHPNFTNHYGGWIGFGPDGFLYVAVGDGGGAGDPGGNAQNPNALLGKMLRIDVTVNAAGEGVDDFPADPQRDYAVPPGNPFAGGGGRPEIWALGLRNPFRNSFDPLTGNLWIGDVGQNSIEEIDLMRPTDGGLNFGWNILEGTQQFSGPPRPDLAPPVAEYGHGSGSRQGNSVTGGYVYRGPVEALRGQYVFADFVRGNLWSFPIAWITLGSTLPSSRFILRNADFAPDQGTIDNIVSFGTDRDQNLYIIDFDGEIFRIEPA